jgi:hypothetical protein
VTTPHPPNWHDGVAVGRNQAIGLVDHDAPVRPGVLGDLARRRFEGAAQDAQPGALVALALRLLAFDRLDRAQ